MTSPTTTRATRMLPAWAGVLAAVACVGCGGTRAADVLHGPERPLAQVWLVRGQGWVFSSGWGVLADRLRATGRAAADLSDRQGDDLAGLVQEARRGGGRERGPLVLVGHSRGGRQVLRAAAELAKAGIAVDLLVTVDVALPPDVPSGVRHVVNVYRGSGRIYPARPLRPGKGCTAVIENVDLDAPGAPLSNAGVHHLTITDDAALQEWLLRRIVAVR